MFSICPPPPLRGGTFMLITGSNRQAKRGAEMKNAFTPF